MHGEVDTRQHTGAAHTSVRITLNRDGECQVGAGRCLKRDKEGRYKYVNINHVSTLTYTRQHSLLPLSNAAFGFLIYL